MARGGSDPPSTRYRTDTPPFSGMSSSAAPSSPLRHAISEIERALREAAALNDDKSSPGRKRSSPRKRKQKRGASNSSASSSSASSTKHKRDGTETKQRTSPKPKEGDEKLSSRSPSVRARKFLAKKLNLRTASPANERRQSPSAPVTPPPPPITPPPITPPPAHREERPRAAPPSPRAIFLPDLGERGDDEDPVRYEAEAPPPPMPPMRSNGASLWQQLVFLSDPCCAVASPTSVASWHEEEPHRHRRSSSDATALRDADVLRPRPRPRKFHEWKRTWTESLLCGRTRQSSMIRERDDDDDDDDVHRTTTHLRPCDSNDEPSIEVLDALPFAPAYATRTPPRSPSRAAPPRPPPPHSPMRQRSLFTVTDDDTDATHPRSNITAARKVTTSCAWFLG